MRPIVVLGLCVACMVCAEAGCGRRGPPVTVRALSFSPDGDCLAVVTESLDSSAGGQSTGPRDRRLVVLNSWTGAVLWRQACSSPGTAWLEDPTRVVFGVEEGSGLHLIAASSDSGATVAKSPPVAGEGIGGIGARGQSTAFVVRRPQGGHDLCLWDLEENTLSQVQMPSGFEPSFSLPPVISGSGAVIAVVDEQQLWFVAYSPASDSWMMPTETARLYAYARPHPPIWEWREARDHAFGEQRWRLGRWGRGDKLLVDERSSALWVAVENSPVGAHWDDRQGRWLVRTHDELVPLDLDSQRALLPATDTETVRFPRVWRRFVESVSSDATRETIAALYTHDTGRNCLLYRGQARGFQKYWLWKWKDLVEDGSAGTSALSVSPAGDRVAYARTRGGEEIVEVCPVEDPEEDARLQFRLK